MGVDFKPVAEAALATAHILLPEWLGGQRRGHEWIGERKANGGLGDSWSVNLNTGAWGHFGGPEKGGDLVSLYAALNHLNQGAALEQVAQLVGVTDRNVPILPRSAPKDDYHPSPIPLSAPDIPGQPTAVYRYGTAFVVARHDSPSGKSFKQWTWDRDRWRGRAHPDPKPIYNLSGLAKSPDAPVLIVEGEKCADAAAKALRSYVVVTWAGGSNAVNKNDWAPLTGRKVLIWPDADEAGGHAGAELVARLLPIAAEVRILNPDDHADGWDAADAIAEGWDAGKIAAWAKDRVRTVDAVPTAPKKSKANGAQAPRIEPMETALTATAPKSSPTIESGDYDDSSPVRWADLGLDMNQGGAPFPTLANASRILQYHPRFKGHVWFDEFTQKICHNIYGSERQWRDEDDEDLTVFIQQSLHLSKFSLNLVHQSVRHAARRSSRNSLIDWLGALKWDGVPRLETWLSDTLGVDLTPHTLAVSRNWPICMVARAYVPGCKADTMPVLEGMTGLRKSTFAEILGSPWYASLPDAFGTKDFLQAVQGRWLIEIPDMTGFSHREHTHILATLSNRVDVYRASYGHYVEEHPRTSIFVGTSETDDYLQDIRGRRRYWPLRCKHIDLDTLRAQRDDIFAEAVHAYRSGATWYEMPPETDLEQRARASPDIWTDKVMIYVEEEWEFNERSGKRKLITSADILEHGLGVLPPKQAQPEKNRIARIMRENGWIQPPHSTVRHWRKVIRREETPK